MKQKREAAQTADNKTRFQPNAEAEAEAQEKRRILGPPEIKSSEVVKGNKLGTGSFGDVWKGTCREQPVAIKILHRQDFDAKQLQVFRREVEVLSQIYHPNVCLFMGACFEKGHMMIVSELVVRGDLEKLLRDQTFEMSLFLRIRLAIDAARGMTWLHNGDPAIVHRDVKPANFLVTENWSVKITDFGLSQATAPGTSLRDGKEGARGTPLWMAPEVLEGKEFSTSADVYSFGIVLWEIYCRQEPFKQFRNYQKFKEAVVKQGVRPKIPPECPRSLSALIERCWAGDSLQRPDFVSILDELETILVDVAIEGDAAANEFWKQFHKGQVDVPWSEWHKNFLAYLGVEAPGSTENQKLGDNPSQDEIQAATKEMLQEFSERSPANYQLVYHEFVRRANAGAATAATGTTTPSPKTAPGGGGGGNSNNNSGSGLNASNTMSSNSSTSVNAESDMMDLEDEEFEAREAERCFNLNIKCLQAILDVENDNSKVNLENFGKILNWFGPVKGKGVPTCTTCCSVSCSCFPHYLSFADPNSSEGFLDRTRNLVSKSWFHGDTQTKDAERLLEGRPDGTFLIRYSNKIPGTFTISKVCDGKTTHQRVSHTLGSGFCIGGNTFSSLEEVVERSGVELKLVTSCPGGKYNHLFLLEDYKNGYIGL